MRASLHQNILITHPINIRYFTGVQVSSGFLLCMPRSMQFFVDSRYREEARDTAKKNVQVRGCDELEPILNRLKSCAFEAEHVSVALLHVWKKRFTKVQFRPSLGIAEEIRRCKKANEIRCLKKAEIITEQILQRIPVALRMLPTEQELAWKMRVSAEELGAERFSFDPIVAFGRNTSRPHHHPTDRRLKKGDLVQIDMGIVVSGYCSDRSMVYFTEQKTHDQQKAFMAVCEAHDAAVACAKRGVLNQELDRVARDILKTYGMEEAFTHALGHGIGLEVHEGITISAHAPAKKLLKGEVITIEPGVYFPGRFGMRVESMVYVQ